MSLSLIKLVQKIAHPRLTGRGIVNKFVYQGRYDSHGNLQGQKPVIGRTYQYLAEHGWTPPFLWSAERCQRFWSSITNSSDHNTPLSYALKDASPVDVLLNIWSPEIDSQFSILEVGCNSGANLEYLRTHGYQQLNGVELNPAAVVQLDASFPELRAISTITVGLMEDVLPQLASQSVDVVFTMGVSYHISPQSAFVFAEMARIAKRYICTIEHETAIGPYVFPRNYSRVFERLGARQVRMKQLDQDSIPQVTENYHGFTARLFAKVP